MRSQQYHMTADCPVCGEKDEINEWTGARMWSSAWGHEFPACSDKCGKKLKEMLKSYSRKKIAALKLRMQDQSEVELFHQ